MDYLLMVVAVVLLALTLVAVFRMMRTQKRLSALDTPIERLAEAVVRLTEGDRDGAFDLMTEMAKSRNAPAGLYVALAALLRQKGHLDRSAHVLRNLLARPNLPEEQVVRTKRALATDLMALGQPDEANALVESLPRKVRKDVTSLELKREAAVRKGDYREALGVSGTLAKARDGDGETDMYARIAEEAAARGDEEAAAKGFQRALGVNPGSVRALYGMAQHYLREGRTGKARRYMIGALEANAALAPLLLPQIRSTMESGRGDPDTQYSELIGDLEKRPELALWVGLEEADHLYESGHMESCRALLERLLEQYPRSIEAYESYLSLLIEVDDDKALRRAVERLVDLAAEEIRRFRCGSCGFVSAKPFMRCNSCGDVGALVYDH